MEEAGKHLALALLIGPGPMPELELAPGRSLRSKPVAVVSQGQSLNHSE